MIYFYLCGFNNNDTNPSFYEEQLSGTEARSGFGWIFLTYRQAVNILSASLLAFAAVP